MFIAVTKENQHVYADSKLEKKKETYFCPGCGNRVFYKSGTLIQAHFAHYNKMNCQTFSEGETKEHLAGKKLLFDWFQRQGIPCQLEAYLPRLKQRPDLLIWPSSQQPIAIEFQCSYLSLKRMAERTRGYQKIGYTVFWIVGNNFCLKKGLTTQQRMYFCYQKEIGFHFYSLSVEQKNLHCYFKIAKEEPFNRLTYEQFVFSLAKNGGTFTQLSQQVNQLKNKIKPLVKEVSMLGQSKYLENYQTRLDYGRRAGDKGIVTFQQYLYPRGESLMTIPKEAYFPKDKNPLFQTISIHWRYLILAWLNTYPVGTFFTEEDYLSYLRQLIAKKKIKAYSMPLVTKQSFNEIMLAYLVTLSEFGLIQKKAPKKWYVYRLAHYYQNEGEKRKDFKKA